MSKKLDAESMRQAAQGNWRTILSTLGGVPIESLDGKHHPCPKCGGDDRFRMIDESAGALFCNQCFAEKNGDGFAAIGWMLDCKFPEALKKIAEHLGVQSAKETKNDPAKDLDWQPWSSQLVKFFTAKKTGVTEEALLAAGAKLAKYKRSFTVFAIPIIGQTLDVDKPVGWIVANYNGGSLPKWNRDGEVVGQVKLKITFGSKPGLVGVHGIERLKTEGLVEQVWKVEGVSDLLSLWSAIPEQLRGKHVVVTNANGASETPRWQASLLAGHNTSVLHDADEPGQAGAKKWSQAIAQQSEKTIRNVQLPYDVVEKSGKDLRDWLAAGNSYNALLDLAEACEPTAAAKTESGEVDYSGAEYPVQEMILKKLQIEILYENEMGHVRVFSQLLRKSSWIKQVDRLKEDSLIQICGPTALAHVSSDPDGEETWSMKDVRKAIALSASGRRGKDDERGVGIWQGLDEGGNETKTVVLVGDTEAARWNGDQMLRRIIVPRCEGLILDFGAGGEDWFEFEQLARHLKSAGDCGWRKSVIDQTREILERWRWQTPDVAPTLATGLILASWIQTVWDWRPLVAVEGESNSGKSFLFEALGGSTNRRGIFGGLAFRQSKSTEAGFRQGIGNTGRIPFCDEFEAGRERDKIQELLRASTRGESIARGTTDQKGRKTTLRHIGWTAAVETGGKRQPDINRTIRFELLPAKKGSHGKLQLPSGGELAALGQKLLAVSVWSAMKAKTLAVELKSTQIDGIDARTVESFGVPAAILAVAGDLDRQQAESLLLELLACVEREEQGTTDQDELLSAIMTSNLHLGPSIGVRTVGQILESQGLMLDHAQRLEASGIKEVEGGLFMHRAAIVRHLLRGTDWETQRIDKLLLRIPGARRSARRISGKMMRGIVIPSPSTDAKSDAF